MTTQIWKLSVNGQKVATQTNLGFATIDRQWKKGRQSYTRITYAPAPKSL
jgi:DUF1680 family protein